MIAADSSTWIAYLQRDGSEDTELLDTALQDRHLLMPPVVLAEGPGHWQRAGVLRAKVLAKRRKARLGDALIPQSRIDEGIPLLTRDRDLRTFAESAGLDLVIGFPSA